MQDVMMKMMNIEPFQDVNSINESKILDGNVTGHGVAMGVPLAWVETNRSFALLVALASCTLATFLSVLNIYQHLQHYTRPQLQRYIVRILVLVPVYAIGSFLSLKFVKQALYFDTIRDIYEAFVVYSFLALVLSFAGGESVCVMKMQGEPEIKHAWPLNRCLHPIGRDGRLLRSCKRASLQFVFIKPIFAILSLVMLACGKYHTLAYQFVLTIVYNISYSLALYGLWLFYLATKHILKSFNPVVKFFAVKSIIFLTFWQSSLVDFVPKITNEQSFAWKDFILCMEMVPFAMLHLMAFNANQFRKNLDRLPDSEVLKNMKEVLSLTDILADAYHSFMPSYKDYMLQRAEMSRGSTRNNRRRRREQGSQGLMGDSDPPSSTSATSQTPTPLSQSENESDCREDESDLECGIRPGRSDSGCAKSNNRLQMTSSSVSDGVQSEDEDGKKESNRERTSSSGSVTASTSSCSTGSSGLGGLTSIAGGLTTIANGFVTTSFSSASGLTEAMKRSSFCDEEEDFFKK